MARRWLLLLSALLFLQIYTEEVPCGAWDPLQAETTAMTTTSQHPRQGPLQECAALSQRGELLQWGDSGELETCGELSVNLPTQAYCAVA